MTVNLMIAPNCIIKINFRNEVEIKKTCRSAGNMENGNIKRTGSFSRLPAPKCKQVIGKARNSSLNTNAGTKRGPQRTRSVSSIPIPDSPGTSGNVDKNNAESKPKLTMPRLK